MMTKKINKIIIYYNDGTFEEIKTGVHDVAPQQNPNFTSPPSILNYPPGMRTPNMTPPWNVTSTCGPGDKYSIATNSNGHVDFSNNNSR